MRATRCTHHEQRLMIIRITAGMLRRDPAGLMERLEALRWKRLLQLAGEDPAEPD